MTNMIQSIREKLTSNLKQRILRYLSKNQSLTIGQLNLLFDDIGVDVHSLMSELESEGFVLYREYSIKPSDNLLNHAFFPTPDNMGFSTYSNFSFYIKTDKLQISPLDNQ